MQIIIPSPTVTRGEIGRALEREIRTGLKLKKATEEARRLKAAASAKMFKDHRPIKGLGRCVSIMPDWEWFRLRQKYGHEELHSKEFMGYFQKKYPELAPHKL
jgi:hypothetical protein